jgi:hypothetical protein
MPLIAPYVPPRHGGAIAATAAKATASLTAAQPALMIISTLTKPKIALSGVQQQSGTMGMTMVEPTATLSNDQPASTIRTTLTQPVTALAGTPGQSGVMGATVTKTTAALTSIQQPRGSIAATASKVKATLAGTSGSFVTRDPLTGNLMLDGQRFMFAGANAPGLGFAEYGSFYGATVDADGLHLSTHSEIDALLNEVDAMNGKAIRVYGGVSSVGKTNSLQPTLGVFNAANLEPIDYALQQCAIRGIKMWFPLVDNYQYYINGKFWYCTVNGVTPDGTASQFFNPANTAIVNSFKAHISYVLDHINVYTGVAYKNDPTVLCWELGNELNIGSGNWTSTQVAWADTISRHIKVTKGAQQLVMDGCAYNPAGSDDGGKLNIDLPYIDIATQHPYYSASTPASVVNATEAAHAHGKAYIVGEFGWNGVDPGGGSVSWTLAQMLSTIEASTFTDGDAYWQLLPPLVGVGGPTQFGLHYPGDDSAMVTRVNQLSAHALAMQTIGMVPAPSHSSPTISLAPTAPRWAATHPTAAEPGRSKPAAPASKPSRTTGCTPQQVSPTTASTTRPRKTPTMMSH